MEHIREQYIEVKLYVDTNKATTEETYRFEDLDELIEWAAEKRVERWGLV